MIFQNCLLRITILKYQSWYLCQISLQVMLLPILIWFVRLIGTTEGIVRISITEVLEVNIIWGKLFVKYCIHSTCSMHVNKVKMRLTWMLFEEILTSVLEGRFSEVESLTEQQNKAFFVSYTACVFAVYLRWPKAAHKHELKLPLFPLTVVIFTKVRLKVKSTTS